MHDPTELEPASFRRALLAWYRKSARPLPWRTHPSLYRTVVSEFMLQQTQVATVLPYFERWMATFPDFSTLASAPEQQVLKHWEGLGYYSRARNLHKLSQIACRWTRPPKTASEWAELPGIGPYTAAAISSIALGAPEACVDGNVVRVLSRLTAEGGLFADSSQAAKALAPLARELLDPRRPGDYNQAMMELGARVCTRPEPHCDQCPVRAQCAGLRCGGAGSIPRFAPKRTRHVELSRAWCVRSGRLLLHLHGLGGRSATSFLELPTFEQARISRAPGRLLAVKRRRIGNTEFTESIHEAEAPGRIPAASVLEWVPLERLGEVSLSGPHRRWIGQLLASR